MHASFGYLPVSAFTPPEEVVRLKQVLAADASFKGSPGLEKRGQILKEWFGDENQVFLECVPFV